MRWLYLLALCVDIAPYQNPDVSFSLLVTLAFIDQHYKEEENEGKYTSARS